jgi:hypothetical protein
VYTVFVLLSKRFKTKLSDTVAILQKEIDEQPKLFEHETEYRRQVFIGKQIYTNFAQLNLSQINLLFKKKLKID